MVGKVTEEMMASALMTEAFGICRQLSLTAMKIPTYAKTDIY
jgi:hypothetical protein